MLGKLSNVSSPSIVFGLQENPGEYPTCFNETKVVEVRFSRMILFASTLLSTVDS
jgi:hypothetical protein